MLKIKDNVDLRELEKYGFEYMSKLLMRRYKKDNITIYENSIHDEEICKRQRIKCIKPRHIYITNNLDLNTQELYSDISNVLYDLIQAGLVEKVEVTNNE